MSNLKLRTILENLDQIPNNHAQAAKFADEKPKLTREEKQNLLAKVAGFNEYANMFSVSEKVVKTANELSEIAKLGKTYAMNETDDMMHKDNINRDFKNLDKVVAEFTKRAKECYGALQNLRVLYEDAGHILERYYEIKDMNPTSEMPSNALPPEEAPVEEIIPNSVVPMKLGEVGVKWD
jgi:hypothetical protein